MEEIKLPLIIDTEEKLKEIENNIKNKYYKEIYKTGYIDGYHNGQLYRENKYEKK